ncbi:MAG: hypothetical protein HC841_09535 [Verrucomicrobiae bacterium]|nr:hypothetical protein [Verrucomicrobiae bacterium]
MHEDILDKLILVVVLGIGAQWLAWRLRLPSILLLLICGFVAGPVTGLIQPDALIGPALMPLVSVSVGLIMFEGGLTLKFRELREAGMVIRRLVTLGALITWIVVALGAHFCFAWPYQQSLLIGAILVVTGPTVVLPLLRYVQPSRATASALKWEGILIDPIGALLALLVFEAIVAQNLSEVPLMALAAFGKTIVIGSALGLLGAAGLAWFIRRHWIPDYLENAMSLMIVVGVFALSNHFQPESGLLTVTLMGVALANQRFVPIQQIVEFKETLRVLLISILFIVLAARIQPEQLRALSWGRGCAVPRGGNAHRASALGVGLLPRLRFQVAGETLPQLDGPPWHCGRRRHVPLCLSHGGGGFRPGGGTRAGGVPRHRRHGRNLRTDGAAGRARAEDVLAGGCRHGRNLGLTHA